MPTKQVSSSCLVTKPWLTLCNPMDHSTLRLSCLPLSPRVCSNSCPLSQWCHPTISSCHPLLLLPSIFPSIRFFPMTRHLESGGQSIEASVSILSVNIQGWFPLGLTGLISLQTKGFSVFSSTTIPKDQSFGAQPSLWSSSHICTWPLEKPQPWLDGPFSAKWRHCFLIHCLGLSELFFQGASVF